MGKMRMLITRMVPVLMMTVATSALAADPYGPYTVDTGSHTCTSQGQEHKVAHDFATTGDRYFIENSVKVYEISKFGSGGCSVQYVQKKSLTVTLQNGEHVQIDVPVLYNVLADADCTNNLSKLGTRVGTECGFSAMTQRAQ